MQGAEFLIESGKICGHARATPLKRAEDAGMA
jgi:hypothetical protein